jgi:hypothetical protein
MLKLLHYVRSEPARHSYTAIEYVVIAEEDDDPAEFVRDGFEPYDAEPLTIDDDHSCNVLPIGRPLFPDRS